MKLTDNYIEKIKHSGKKKDGSIKMTPDKVLDSDCPGLMLIVRKSGTKTWAMRKKVGGRSVEAVLGRWGRTGNKLNCRGARHEFHRLSHVVKDGFSEYVASHRKQKAVGVFTITHMVEFYRDRYGISVLGWEWGTVQNVNNRIATLKKAPLVGVDVSNMNKADASRLFVFLRSELGFSKRRLREFFGTLSQAFMFCADEDLIKNCSNVFDWALRNRIMKMPAEKDFRDYLMNDQEIRTLWNFSPFKGSRTIPGGMPADPMKSLEGQTIYRLLLLTGIRVGEIRNSRWSDWENSEVVRNPDTGQKVRIPLLQVHEHKTAKKTLSPLYVPLSQPIIDLLTAYQNQRRSNSPWVFPLLTGGDFKDSRRRAGGTSIAQQISRELKAEFHLHDIRTAVATRLGDMGYPSALIGKILNHSVDKRTTTGKHYNHSNYLIQKLEMYSAWLAELNRILANSEDEIVNLAKNQFSNRSFQKADVLKEPARITGSIE